LLLVALGTFSITGVGGDEVLAYNYWLIEKGYASFTGPEPEKNSTEWLARAKGWIRVMQLDAALSMVCYTLVTALFYLLGAAILHSQKIVPEGNQLITVLSKMYTQSLGPWAETAFLIGAVVVLLSTLLAALAAWTRLFTTSGNAVNQSQFSRLSSPSSGASSTSRSANPASWSSSAGLSP
jgi:hypothetical protein